MPSTDSQRIDQAIAELGDWRGKTLARVRRIFLAAHPEMTEAWKWMGSPVWYCQGMIAVANAHVGKVKVTFNKGARLPDPHHLFNAGLGGNAWRAIDLLEGDRIPEGPLTELIRAAVALNQAEGSAERTSPSKGARRRRSTAPRSQNPRSSTRGR